MTLLTVAGALAFLLQPAFSREPIRPPKKSGNPAQQVNFRSACTTAQAQIDQDINNVRARLLTGGDLWWDRNDGKYVVPKPLPGQPEVSAIFAAGIWLGGFDDGGNLKMACQTYGNWNGNGDFWPGPLTLDEGITEAQTCNNWDRHFEVKGTDIKYHLMRWQMELEEGLDYPASDIPASVKGWPGRGNPFFSTIHGFDIPNTDQGLAAFYDQDGDGNYEPLDGDFPTIEMWGCYEFPTQFPDQMIFWIYNDEGGGAIHNETHGIPIRMEIQATAFAYATDDQLNDMTFQRHKFINREKGDVDYTYFGLWMDADLGCYLDDYFGCDPARNLAYVYNADATDGQPGINCDGVPTYGTNIPAVGIDILRGPLDENGNELRMSSFAYFTWGDAPPGLIDPAIDIEFYRFLTGSWKDGTRLTYGGDGYDPQGTNYYPFTFPSPPNDPNGWSMCHPGPEFPTGLPSYDRRTVQSCGPFILQPGAVNELIFGVIWTPNMHYPCPDLSRLFAADDYAQALFDNCMSTFVDGPDAPDVDWVAGDREINLILSNSEWSNNRDEDFQTEALGHLKGVADTTYDFEGYLIYQMAGPGFGFSDIGDTTKARLAFQCDVENGFSRLTNWRAEKNPNYQLSPEIEQFVHFPDKVIEGENTGIQHSISFSENLFATGDDRRLVNHCTYYYLAVAYAANDFMPFNPATGVGQRQMFVIGRNNIGPNGDGFPYGIMPRPAQSGLLDKVQIVPNPYYHRSAYADSDGNGYLKITNLPAKCEVDIYSLSGNLVRHFSRNEQPGQPNGSGVEALQPYPDLDWDLTNTAGKSVAGGVYLVRIRAEGVGEVTLKAVII